MLPLRDIFTILCIIDLCSFTGILVSVVTDDMSVLHIQSEQSSADQTVLFTGANIGLGLEAARHAVWLKGKEPWLGQ